MKIDKIIIAGGSGFLGQTLAKWYQARGTETVILSRDPSNVACGKGVAWNGRTLDRWSEELEKACALINLAGRSVNCRYHKRNRKQMMDSRVDSTRILGEAIRNCKQPPPVWLNSSTATIYKHTHGPAHDEDGEIGATPEAKDAFSIEVAKAWEDAFENSVVPSQTRKITLRSAMVFGTEPGGVYEVLRKLVRFRMGGKMGSGRQYVSWIHAGDFCRAIDWFVRNSGAQGLYNLSAPHPVTNADMMAHFRRILGVKLGLPAPRPFLELGALFARTETELIIKSRRVVPARLIKEGFQFEFPTIDSAIENLEARMEES